MFLLLASVLLLCPCSGCSSLIACMLCHTGCLQTITFGDRTLTLTIGALPSFQATRQTSNPDVAMWIVIGIALLIVALAVVILVLFNRKHGMYLDQLVENEKQKRRFADSARAAHEKTIAYASHQLR